MAMELNEFVELTHQVRVAQRRFYRTHRQEDLNAAKALERQLDDVIEEHRGQARFWPVALFDEKGK